MSNGHCKGLRLWNRRAQSRGLLECLVTSDSTKMQDPFLPISPFSHHAATNSVPSADQLDEPQFAAMNLDWMTDHNYLGPFFRIVGDQLLDIICDDGQAQSKTQLDLEQYCSSDICSPVRSVAESMPLTTPFRSITERSMRHMRRSIRC